EVEERKCIVYSNTVRSMVELVEAAFDLGLQFEDASLLNYVEILRDRISRGLEFAPISGAIKQSIQHLWQTPSIQIAYEKRANYQIHDSANYFFDQIERIAKKDYRPTNMDILLTRVPTTGVVKLLFTLRNIDFNVYDVGGQRSERRKWIHFFDDVNAIIFVVAISEYDQKIREDNKTVC
uniref:G-protein alpha subunit n=1 Tax=Globodera pallida TaxID=36090 RepID=A0A183CRG1_GLOPA